MPDSRIAECFEELIRVMAQLREEDGCPWDREQTHESLKPYLIEEAYEAIEALDGGDDEAFKEELGDVLLQVVFHARIAEERGGFDIADVVTAHVAKLKRRHPHVFGGVSVEGMEEIWANWERIKKEEDQTRTSVLSGVPKSLPALLKARRVQEKASLVGFDWEQADEVWKKVAEELSELKEACATHKQDAIREEMGDLLFSLVNYARFLDVDPEDALQRTVDKFTRRFRAIEEELAQSGRTPADASFEEMDALWEEGKKGDRKGKMQSEK
ncbi:MAG: nucleoside triphosphate pyrophosphohydrolase [Candidatus Latescibacterota bacterium]